MSSEEELKALFGRPREKSLNVDADIVLSWSFNKIGTGIDERHRYQTLNVVLDRNNRVRDYVIIGNVDQP